MPSQSPDIIQPGAEAGLAEAKQRLLRTTAVLVAETHPDQARQITLHSHLERDLGLDSLGRVELALRLGQEFSKRLPENVLTEAERLGDLLRFVCATGACAVPLAKTADLDPAASNGIPEQARTLTEVLEWHAEYNPQRTHVLLYGEEEQAEAISYAQLFAESRRIASGLVARGLRPQQAVALMLPTGRSYLSSFFAVMLAGGIPVPIYPPARLAQIEEHLQRHARILANAEAVFIITVTQAKGVAALLRRDAPVLREIITPEELDMAPMDLLYRAIPEDIAFLQYTSGSTGDPKGVVLTHANLLANLRAMGEAIGVSGEDVFVSWLPLYHDMGLIGAWLGSLYFAMPLVLMSPLAFLAQPERWLNAISRHHGTLSAAPNFAYELCARRLADADLQGLDLSSWRLAMNGAEPVSPATLTAFAQRFAPCGLRRDALTPVYGLAECSVGLAFPPLGRGPRVDFIQRATLDKEKRALPALAEDSTAIQVAACGRPLPRHEIRIVDEAGGELEDRQIGRLQFRGPSTTRGYYRNPRASAALFEGSWLNSGDYAYTLEGEIYLTGRVKDMIIRGGRNLYPYELEQRVGNLPGVRKGCVAVFASRDPISTNERLVIIAETRESAGDRHVVLRQAIADTALDTLGTPADVIVLALPNAVRKTSSGKIRRSATRDAYEQGLIDQPGTPYWQQLFSLGLGSARAALDEGLQRTLTMLFASWCWLVFALLALPAALLVIALQNHATGRYTVHIAARCFLALTGLHVKHHDMMPTPTTAHMLLVNHSSYFDVLALYAVLPPSAGYRFVAKREFVKQRWMAAFMRGLGTLFVERFDATKSAEDVEEIVAALRRGDRLVLFPEGTFSRESGLKPFRMGAFVAAARAAAPVLVAVLRGSRIILRDQTWRPRRGELEFIGGKTFTAEGADWAAAVQLRDAAREEMLQLCGEHDLARVQKIEA